jgi:hypothetical protein
VQPQVIYAPYYNPYVVYGPWWWPAYRPVFWRPWHPRPAVFVSTSFFSRPLDWQRRHITRVAPRQVVIQQVGPAAVQHRSNPAYFRQQARPQPRAQAPAPVSVFNHVQQAQFARPIVQQHFVQQHFEPRQIHAPRALPQGGGQRQANQLRGGRG